MASSLPNFDSNQAEDKNKISPSLDGEPGNVKSLNDASDYGSNGKDSCHLGGSVQSSISHEGSGSHELSPSSHDQHSRLHGSDLSATSESLHDILLEAMPENDSRSFSKLGGEVLSSTTDVIPEGMTPRQWKAIARKQRKAIRKEKAW